MLWQERHPFFYLPANSNFSVTITAKLTTTARSIPTINATATIGTDMQITTVLTSAMAQITPIADLAITNSLTGMNPSISGDVVSYFITLQNIWSTQATGISFISNFPIPTLFTPTATFDGISYTYNTIQYPQDFVWNNTSFATLNPGQIRTILLSAPMAQNFSVGTTFNQIAKTTTASPEYATSNNSATASSVVQAAADVWITKTLAPFVSYKAGDSVVYMITYGNNWGKSANNVTITDIAPTNINLPTTNFSLWTIPAWSGGSILLTGTLETLFTSGQVFVNTAKISTTSNEITTWNNSATVTGTIQGITSVNLNISANNLTHPAYDNAPYGSWPNTLIQAISGDLIQFTITYGNFWNTVATNGVISLADTQGLSQLTTYNGTIGTLPLNTTWTLIITGVIGPKNYISLTPIVRLNYNTTQTLSDSIIIQEPLVCGDGILTRNEPCDIQGNLWVLYSGQVCENQQGICVLITKEIINNACINYQYANPLGWTTTGQTCSSVNAALMNSSCASMTGSIPNITSNGYSTNFTCRGNTTTSTTPITIDCGNGTSISWTGNSFNWSCNYTSSFVGNAQCRVWNDTNNGLCRVPVSKSQLQCRLDTLDGRIILVNSDGEWEGRFRCETLNGATAQEIKIDCGTGGTSKDGWRYALGSNVSRFETFCSYDENTVPQNKIVSCFTDGLMCDSANIIVDEPTLWYCGDGIVEWYEDCDDGEDNGSSSSSCTKGCDDKDTDSEMVGCFNIGNNNISIQKWEILPFRWTLDAEKNVIAWNTCDGKADGKIPEDSIQCTFSIYNWENTEEDNDPVYTITKKCNENNRNGTLFNYFTNQSNNIWSLKNAFGKYTIDSDRFVTDVFWEYKVVLDKVSYQYCRSDDKDEGTEIDRVCSVNFTVTKPYLIQKSSFGITPKATTIPLDGYYNLGGNTLITDTDLDKIMVLDADTYKWGNSIATMMDNFIKKYSKIAVTYTTIKSDEGNTITVSKVPGQDIVVFKGEGTLPYTDTNKTKPYTVILDGPSLKINWSIENTNAMFLLNKWDITILPAKDACTKTQIIKWIFVTKQWSFLAGSDNLTNDDTSKQWCAFGWLKVQWVLIGNNIDNLVQSRRSQLNHWFTVWGASDAAIKAERRNEIFNWAAVLIEYSPSLWNALPPGASEFTKALDVYKQ